MASSLTASPCCSAIQTSIRRQHSKVLLSSAIAGCCMCSIKTQTYLAKLAPWVDAGIRNVAASPCGRAGAGEPTDFAENAWFPSQRAEEAESRRSRHFHTFIRISCDGDTRCTLHQRQGLCMKVAPPRCPDLRVGVLACRTPHRSLMSAVSK